MKSWRESWAELQMIAFSKLMIIDVDSSGTATAIMKQLIYDVTANSLLRFLLFHLLWSIRVFFWLIASFRIDRLSYPMKGLIMKVDHVHRDESERQTRTPCKSVESVSVNFFSLSFCRRSFAVPETHIVCNGLPDKMLSTNQNIVRRQSFWSLRSSGELGASTIKATEEMKVVFTRRRRLILEFMLRHRWYYAEP